MSCIRNVQELHEISDVAGQKNMVSVNKNLAYQKLNNSHYSIDTRSPVDGNTKNLLAMVGLNATEKVAKASAVTGIDMDVIRKKRTSGGRC